MFAIIQADPPILYVSYDIDTKPPFIIWSDGSIETDPDVGVSKLGSVFVNKVLVANAPTSLHVANGSTLSYDANTFTVTQTLTWTEPDDMKDVAKDRIVAWRTTQQNNGFSFANVVYQSDPVSRSTIEGAVQMAIIANMSNTAYDVSWTALDNSQHDMDANTVIQFGVTAAMSFEAWHQQSLTLKTQIDAANSAADVQAILDSVGA